MNVPDHLFTPVMLAEGPKTTCGCPLICIQPASPVLYRVDGEPEECGCLSARWFSTREVTVRAFVVNGRSPATLADLDGNGEVDIRDARRAGFRLLSEQAEFRFTQHYDTRMNYHLFDVNGDGQVPIFDVHEEHQGYPGALTNPPR